VTDGNGGLGGTTASRVAARKDSADAASRNHADCCDLTHAFNSEETLPRVIYCCDVEGHWPYFCNFVDLCGNDRLRFVERSDQRNARKAPELELADGWHFVFGGDSCDKGPGSLRFVECMVQFKRKYPERVHLILGNRDINKMRWTAELDQREINRILSVPPVFWLHENTRISPLDYVRRVAAEAEGVAESQVSGVMLAKHNTKANKVRYMLKHDMGSDGDFEFRRDELAMMKGVEASEVSDEAVVASYESWVAEGGSMREYLRLGQLVLFLGNTLFVHGQVIGNQFRCCPGGDEQWSVRVVPTDDFGGFEVVEDLPRWADKLNAWAARQIEAWQRQPTWKKPPIVPERASWRARGGSTLIAYGTPATDVPSVVYCRWLGDDCMPRNYPEDLVKYLTSNGVHSVVVGHTPHGNCPTVIPHNGLTVLMGDTSYSHMNANVAFAGDNRGDAVSLVILELQKLRVTGRTQVKQFLEYEVGPKSNPHLVGITQKRSGAAKDRYFVKARVYEEGDWNSPSYLMCKVEGFKNDYTVLKRDEALLSLEGQAVCRNSSSLSQLTSHGDMDEHFKLRHLWNHLMERWDHDCDGSISKQELKDALTEAEVRNIVSTAFPGLSVDAIAQELKALRSEFERLGESDCELTSFESGGYSRASSPPSSSASSATTSATTTGSSGGGAGQRRRGGTEVFSWRQAIRGWTGCGADMCAIVSDPSPVQRTAVGSPMWRGEPMA